MTTRQPTKAQLNEKIERLEKELAQKIDQLLRSHADHQNYRKRVQKDFDGEIKKEKGKIISKIFGWKMDDVCILFE